MKKWFLTLLFTPILLSASQVVVFDFGGVMAHPDRSVIVQFLCKTLPFAPEEVVAELRSQIAREVPQADAWCAYGLERGIVLPDGWFSDFQTAQEAALGSDPEMYALVDELKGEGIQVALLSNIAARYGKIVRAFNLYDPFEPVLLSYEIGVEKPDPEAYEILLDRLGQPPEEVIFIDDLPENVEAARQMGIDAILFESPKQIREELERRSLLTPSPIPTH